MYAMAVAAGGEQTPASQQQLLRLSAGPGAAQQEISQAQLELLQARSVKLSSSPTQNASADFNLVFDGSSRPERAEYSAGDSSLRAAEQQIREKDYPVKFPDVSSVKIVRRGTLSGANAVCTFVLQPFLKYGILCHHVSRTALETIGVLGSHHALFR